MTFLQPFILWGLPLILVPVIIHLINRLRHRRQAWAAMRFLLMATRSSISHAKLRQFLILLFRVLAVAALVLFLARPLAGGWLGWALASAPDAILILLDRSTSMETRLPGSNTTRREQAIQLLAEAAKDFAESSHLVLIDSAGRTPQRIGNIAQLGELSLAAATDTAADLPAMVQAAVQWLIDNRAGTAEIWIASDLQRSNWLPDDSRWKTLTGQLASLPQKVRVRLLGFEPAREGNISLALREIVRRQRGGQSELHFVVDAQSDRAVREALPLTLTLDGVTSQHELRMDGQALRWRHRVELGAKKAGGWGRFSLPADVNGRDNSAYFVYGPETPLRGSVVAANASSGKPLQLALTALATGSAEPVRALPPAEAGRLALEDSTLVAWQGALPEGAAADQIRAFVQDGGVAIFFPPGSPDAQRFNGVAWGEAQAAGEDKSFRVLRWDEDQGPLARTDEGIRLPLDRAEFQRRQGMIAAPNAFAVLAAFDDGAPMLARQTLGKGEIYFCATQPGREWSSLGEGPVLVPMMQRLLQTGSRRLQQASLLTAGELSVAEQGKIWTALDAADGKDAQLHAGVYRAGERLAAVNRPPAEDEPEVIEGAQAQGLLGGLAFQMLQDQRGTNEGLQGEVWRMLLAGMLVFLLVEGILMMPGRSKSTVQEKPNDVNIPARLETVEAGR